MARMEPPVDFAVLCQMLNDEEPDNPITVDGLISLLSASSIVSASALPMHEEDDGAEVNPIEKYSDGENRPDIMMEETEASYKLRRAMESLTLRERKLLKMKGVGT